LGVNTLASRFLVSPRSGGSAAITRSFVWHSMVMPAVDVVDTKKQPLRMVTQPSPPGSGTPWGRAAVWLWSALLGLGVWAAWARRKRNAPLRRVLGLVLLGQLILHLLYGEETFLYSLHWLPLLVILAAFSALTRLRPVALTLATALLVCAGVNNFWQFEVAVRQVDRFLEARLQAAQVAAGEPAPQGHNGLALPGAGGGR